MNVLSMSRTEALKMLSRATGIAFQTLDILLEEEEEKTRARLSECDDKFILYHAVRALIGVITAGGGS